MKKLQDIANIYQLRVEVLQQQKNWRQINLSETPYHWDQFAVQMLSELEQNTNYHLSSSDLQMREYLFKWVVAKCRLALELKVCTIEHCLKLFDLFIKQKGRFVSSLDEAKLTLLTCLFISCKYQEIYPPSITDFEYVSKYKFQAKDFLSLELQILSQINFTLNIPLTSEWIYALSGKDTPQWVLICLPSMTPEISSCKLAKKIIWMEKEVGAGMKQMQLKENPEVLLKKLAKIY